MERKARLGRLEVLVIGALAVGIVAVLAAAGAALLVLL